MSCPCGSPENRFPRSLPFPEHSYFGHYSFQHCGSCPLHTNEKLFLQAQNLQSTVLKAVPMTRTQILLVFCFRESEIPEDNSLKEVSCWDSHCSHRIKFPLLPYCVSQPMLPKLKNGKVVWAEGTTVSLGNSMNRNRKKGLCKRPCICNGGLGNDVFDLHETEIRTD